MTSATTDVTVASSAEDADAVEAVTRHHAELASRLAVHVESMLTAAGGPDSTGFETVRRDAVRFCTDELAPHAAAEEESLYPVAAASERARLLVDGMLSEHRVLHGLIEEVATARQPLRAAAAGYALRVLFEAHLEKENDLVLPIVAADPTASLAGVLHGMHELLGGHDHGDRTASDRTGTTVSAGGCGCGESDSGAPELDVRAVPHAIRHATVLGAFDTVPSGGSLQLVAPHDPLPLLRRLTERAGGSLEVTYTERGPAAWRLLLRRT